MCFAVLKELNYRPNFIARALVTGKTLALGLVVPDLIHPFFGDVAKGLADMLLGRGYDLLMASSEEVRMRRRRRSSICWPEALDALIVASALPNSKFFEQVATRQVPYVLIGRYFDGRTSNFIGVDDEKVGVLATKHLMSVGCRRIAHIRGPKVSTASGRAKGYRKAPRRGGLEARPAVFRSCERKPEMNRAT